MHFQNFFLERCRCKLETKFCFWTYLEGSCFGQQIRGVSFSNKNIFSWFIFILGKIFPDNFLSYFSALKSCVIPMEQPMIAIPKNPKGTTVPFFPLSFQRPRRYLEPNIEKVQFSQAAGFICDQGSLVVHAVFCGGWNIRHLCEDYFINSWIRIPTWRIIPS